MSASIGIYKKFTNGKEQPVCYLDNVDYSVEDIMALADHIASNGIVLNYSIFNNFIGEADRDKFVALVHTDQLANRLLREYAKKVEYDRRQYKLIFQYFL